MRKLITSIALVLFLVAFISVNAQVKTDLNNTDKITAKGKFFKVYKTEIDFEIPAKNIKDLLEKEKTDYTSTNEDKPFRLATPVPVDIDIAKLANWTTDGEFVYGKFSIRVKGALSSSINFDEFNLPPNSEMYIYNENGNMITGPVTENENNLNNVWGSWVYQGEYLNIEIKTPTSTMKQLKLHSNNIAYGYKHVYQTETAGFGTSEPCNINVICPLGTGWEAERNSVSLVLGDNGEDLCSGAMVMNTCSTNRPFFLTANHCFTGQNVTAWRFMFQAWSPTCPHPGINNDGVTYNGSTLRANWAGTDFCLVELNNTPPVNSGINYAGWNRNTAGITQTTIIHHPQGDVMKISRDIQAPVFDGFSGAQCWRLGLDQGATQGGSSGSPYFDQNHRIIGQHFGIDDGNLPVCNRSRKFGGRFDLSWTGGGTNATRLSNWLDPGNTGAIFTNTTNVSTLLPAATPGSYLPITGSNVVCSSSATYSITGVQAGASVVWSLQAPDANGPNLTLQNVCTLSPNGAQVTLTKVNDGTVKLFATITNCGGVVQYAAKTVTFGVPELYGYVAYNPNIVYMPVDGTVTYTNSSINYVTLESSVNNSYVWEYGGGTNNAYYYFGYNNGPTFATLGWNTPVYPYDNLGFSIHTTNACGTRSDPLYFYYDGPYQYYRIAPNPVKSTFTISQVDFKRNATPAGKTELNVDLVKIHIVDKMGNIVLEKAYPKNTKAATINTANLKSDLYTVRLFTKDKVEAHKLVVQH